MSRASIGMNCTKCSSNHSDALFYDGVVSELTKKQRRQKEQRRQLLFGLAIVVLVAVVVLAVLGYNKWKDEQVETLPQDQRIVAVVDGEETEVAPYSTCEVDAPKCEPGAPHRLDLKGAKEFTLKLPQDVYDHDWALLKVYDDPGANTDDYFKANEKQEVNVKLDAERKSGDGSTPKLAVVEIQSLLIGLDKEKNQTPVTAVWSFEVSP